MCLREHILDFITRPYIPVWNTVFPHNLLPFRCKSLTFSYLLHYCKCKLTFKSFLDKVYHNVISCTYRRRYGCLALFKKCLCVTKPYISSVWKPCNSYKVRKILWLSINKHLHSKICTKLWYSKCTKLTTANILRCNSKCRSILE